MFVLKVGLTLTAPWDEDINHFPHDKVKHQTKQTHDEDGYPNQLIV